ncbi:MAG TPA: hypothetical protein PLM29_06715 [Deltaproteobacteria bacterium]|nr:hypothetical protein [Deltaproteobacteria bacterium]
MNKRLSVASLKNLEEVLIPSIKAEGHMFLLLIPVALKEMICIT